MMWFWITGVVLALLATLYAVGPLLRPARAEAASDDLAFYKAQLAELERDLDRGLVPPAEADGARAEIGRRILEAARHSTQATDRRPSQRIALVTGAVVLAIAGLAYSALGTPTLPDQPLAARHAQAADQRASRPDQAALMAMAPTPPPVEAPADYLEAVEQLRTIMTTRTDDIQGWTLLARQEAALRNFGAALEAQRQVVALKAGDATLQDRHFLLDLLASAANGWVSPEAETLARALLDADPDDPVGRYYLGALYDQTGRSDLAFGLWRPLVEAGDGYHAALARRQISGAAARSGVDYDPPALRGPSLDDIENAEDMSREDRAAMIGSMVSSLTERLATQGGTVAEWAQLIRAYGVLGETQTAAEILAEARDVFGSDAGSLRVINQAAEAVGLP